MSVPFHALALRLSVHVDITHYTRLRKRHAEEDALFETHARKDIRSCVPCERWLLRAGADECAKCHASLGCDSKACTVKTFMCEGCFEPICLNCLATSCQTGHDDAWHCTGCVWNCPTCGEVRCKELCQVECTSCSRMVCRQCMSVCAYCSSDICWLCVSHDNPGGVALCLKIIDGCDCRKEYK
jgi:hypothetical protein